MSAQIAELAEPRIPSRAEPHVLRRRLLPLYLATFLQNLALWVPIEKLFMTTIGFNSASIGLMASVYAVVVPNPRSAVRCARGSVESARRPDPRLVGHEVGESVPKKKTGMTPVQLVA